MPDSLPRTFFALPMTNYEPNDLIQLGQVIKDPIYPFQRIAPPLPLKGKLKPKTSRLREFAATSTRTSATSVGLASHILNMIKRELSTRQGEEETLTWDAALLETHFFEPNEDGTLITQLQEDSKAVRQWLRKVRLPGKSAYVITGIKIAVNPSSISCDTFDEVSLKAQLEAIVETLGQATIGVSAENSRLTRTTVTGKPIQSYVFAYQLREIKVNPITGTPAIGPFRPGGEVYGDGDETEPEEDSDEEGYFDSSDDDDEGLPRTNDKLSLDIGDFGSKLPDVAFGKKKIDLENTEESYVLISTKP